MEGTRIVMYHTCVYAIVVFYLVVGLPCSMYRFFINVLRASLLPSIFVFALRVFITNSLDARLGAEY